ncbi:MAG: nucleotide exchange factor GrpE [Parafannyhessea sp.]|uniref:nucleotide exchange factor GrpE n=1 Tax=Parafannyhessea sp. TaxID=2847324 RepID=UPI003F0C85FC
MFGKDNKKGAAQAAPGKAPEEGEVKVPIETDDATASVDDATKADAKSDAQELSPEEEQRLTDEAIRRGEQAAADDLKADADKLRAERDELQKKYDSVADDIAAAKKEAAEAVDRLTRTTAEWQNFRRRTAQERERERERATEKLVSSLLPVIDDMERAIDHAGKTAGDNEQLKQFVEGIDQVHTKMVSILQKEGVEVIDPAGQPFDPMAHQAVGRTENKDVYDETVDQVYQKGYRMGGKVIRSAMVTVSYGGPKRPAQEAKDDGSSKSSNGSGAPNKDAGSANKADAQ